MAIYMSVHMCVIDRYMCMKLHKILEYVLSCFTFYPKYSSGDKKKKKKKNKIHDKFL